MGSSSNCFILRAFPLHIGSCLEEGTLIADRMFSRADLYGSHLGISFWDFSSASQEVGGFCDWSASFALDAVASRKAAALRYGASCGNYLLCDLDSCLRP